MNTKFTAAAQAIADHFQQAEARRGEPFGETFIDPINNDAVTPNTVGIPVALLRALVEAEMQHSSPSASTAALARVVRERGEALLDLSRDMEGNSARLLRDNAELACVLARVLNGKHVLRALGAPGDWGYEHPVGKALIEQLQSGE